MEFPRDLFVEQIKDYDEDFKRATVSYIDKLTAKKLPVVFSLKHLSEILAIPHEELRRIVACPCGFYAYYTIRKRNGGYRRIVAPYANLKRVQTWILRNILEQENVSPACNGFVIGRNTLQNAKPHEGKTFIRKFDLANFFESITFQRVYHVFLRIGYSPAVSHDFATICTISVLDDKFKRMPIWKQQVFGDLHNITPVLAQGSPTSPMLANIICNRLDKRLEGYALKHGIQYTRYADDLTFSADDRSDLPSISFIRKVISSEHFELNNRKTGTFGINSRQMVTGILVNKKLHLPQQFKRQIYRHLHFCEKFGPRTHFASVMPDKSNARDWLYGKIRYVYSIEPEEAEKMFRIADNLDWGIL